jgi:hypothetical protein
LLNPRVQLMMRRLQWDFSARRKSHWRQPPGTVSSVVDDWWTQSVCPINESAKSGGSDASRICDLAEAFLVGRVVHFIGYVVPQLQQMIAVELLFLPGTLKVSLWLKRIENVDYFDKGTNFNPLKF